MGAIRLGCIGGAAFLLLGASGAGAQTAPVARTVVAPVPAAVFAEKPGFSVPKLSPDATRVAAVEHTGTKTRLLVVPLAGKETEPSYYDVGVLPIADVRWAGPNRLLVRSELVLEVLGMTMPIAKLTVVDLQTKAQHDLDPKNNLLITGEVLHIDPRAEWLLLAAPKALGDTPAVRRIDISSGASEVVEKARPNVWSWFADTAGVVRAGIAYDNDRWTMWYRDRPGAPLAKVRSPRFEGSEGSVDSVYFFPGENAGAILTNARTGRFAAYRFDFRTGQIGEAIYEHPAVDVTAILPDPTTRSIAGISYEDERARVAWTTPAMQTVQKRLDKAFPDLDTVVVDSSADGKHLLVWSGGASDPGTFYTFDIAARRLEALGKPYHKLSEARLSKVAPIRYTARDGLAIPGYLTLPQGRADKNLPLIVLPHGGPFARDGWRYDPFVQFFASRGYAVLQPNFRGSTGYGKSFVEQGYGQWGRKMQDDVDDGVDWLAGQGIIDPKRVCIMGTSYGGYVALWGAIRNPERYRCAASLAGVTDLPGMLRYDRRMFNATRYFKQWQQRVSGEKDVDLKALSPLAQASRLRVPVLIAHGTLDRTVPAQQAQQMIKALAKRKDLGPEISTAFYEGEGHGLESAANLTDFLTRLETFLAKHNPADPPAN
ncbi:S9 family peptidase [Sphingomonas sp. LM7]|uniref:alpha/beta hydrolase family protein n=1 Tax=Sphingomonas sp. LM7 TaxID=1938607 RepID=UPI000983D08F|nr:S9 family peptidase [Sphingomonas sp. LM7]AQR72797.1 hypothetical protein BXU08_03125 [Sphingomonas sp. LM7]